MDPTRERAEAEWPGLPAGRCARCLYRLEWCLCGAIPTLETRTRIVVVRQHSERFRSSNTGRLAHLALVNSALCDVGGPERRPFELAAAVQERDRLAGQCVGLALTGGNVDASVFARVLGGQ